MATHEAQLLFESRDIVIGGVLRKLLFRKVEVLVAALLERGCGESIREAVAAAESSLRETQLFVEVTRTSLWESW